MSDSWYNSRYPRDVDLVNAAIPTSLTSIFTGDGEIYEVNISNPTAGLITILVQDAQGSPLALIPTINIPANTLDLILYQGTGVLAKGGASWQAGGAGLVGSVRGRKVTGWTVQGGAGSGGTYCFNTST